MADEDDFNLARRLKDVSLEEAKKAHPFWDTQPVPKLTGWDSESCVNLEDDVQLVEESGPLEPIDKEIRQEPFKLPDGFEWSTINVDDPAQVASRLSA
jgi:glycylpeptide N-tetradecanoyltransferase